MQCKYVSLSACIVSLGGGCPGRQSGQYNVAPHSPGPPQSEADSVSSWTLLVNLTQTDTLSLHLLTSQLNLLNLGNIVTNKEDSCQICPAPVHLYIFTTIT